MKLKDTLSNVLTEPTHNFRTVFVSQIVCLIVTCQMNELTIKKKTKNISVRGSQFECHDHTENTVEGCFHDVGPNKFLVKLTSSEVLNTKQKPSVIKSSFNLKK